MHLIDPLVGMVAAVPIVGSSLPIAVGLAWANKLKKLENIVVVFFGDGAIEEGTFHESLNFAVLHSLPILFVCENNNFSVYTSLDKRQSKVRKISSIASASASASTMFCARRSSRVWLSSFCNAAASAAASLAFAAASSRFF